MIQTQQQSLSESDIGTLKDWLMAPGADLFLSVIRSEQALTQAEAGFYYMSIDRKYIEEDKKEIRDKARYLSNAADELQWLLDKFAEMRADKYEFKTVTLTP